MLEQKINGILFGDYAVISFQRFTQTSISRGDSPCYPKVSTDFLLWVIPQCCHSGALTLSSFKCVLPVRLTGFAQDIIIVNHNVPGMRSPKVCVDTLQEHRHPVTPLANPWKRDTISQIVPIRLF